MARVGGEAAGRGRVGRLHRCSAQIGGSRGRRPLARPRMAVVVPGFALDLAATGVDRPGHAAGLQERACGYSYLDPSWIL